MMVCGMKSHQKSKEKFSLRPGQRGGLTRYILLLASTGIYFYLQYVKERDKRENEELRKTEELELARQFQLDLLPSYIPRLPEYEIAAKIDTATEVGGDYYDFFEQEDGSIYLVTGDATGHGMTAGMMVSILKQVFMVYLSQILKIL